LVIQNNQELYQLFILSGAILIEYFYICSGVWKMID